MGFCDEPCILRKAPAVTAASAMLLDELKQV
jgi:hypothetical protein